MYMKISAAICILFICFFPEWGSGVQFVVYTPGKAAPFVGHLTAQLNEEQVQIIFTPNTIQNGPSSAEMQFCPFYNHIDPGTLPTIASYVLFKPEDRVVKSYINILIF